MTSGGRRSGLAGLGVLVLVAGLASSCGGSGAGRDTPTPPPAATSPPGFPRVAATGALPDGSRWEITETGLDQVCVAVRQSSGTCVDLTATWLVAALPPEASGRGSTLVLAGLPCGVARVELRRGGEAIASSPTVAKDDVTYAVLEAGATIAGVELVALAREGSELFRVDRLDDDPATRVPTVGC